MRIRTIKPDFFSDEKLGELPATCRLAFIGLWCAADREGRLEDRPRKLQALIMPYDACDMSAMLDDLARAEIITRYEADGERYIQINNFAKHQKPNHKEQPSTIPAPRDHGVPTAQPRRDHGVPTAQPRRDHGVPTAQPRRAHGVPTACPRVDNNGNPPRGEVEIEIEGKGNITPPTPPACPEIEYCPETGKVERGRELEAIQEKRAVAAAVQSEIDPMAAMYSQGIETLCEAWKAAKKAKGMPGVVDGKTKEGLALLAGMVERGDLSIDQAKAVVSRFINHPDRNRPDDKWGAMAMAKNFTRFLSPEKGMNRPPGDSSGKWIDAKCPKCGSKSAAFVGKSPKEVVCPNDKCKAKFTVGG